MTIKWSRPKRFMPRRARITRDIEAYYLVRRETKQGALAVEHLLGEDRRKVMQLERQ